MNHVYMFTIRDENETVYRCTYEDLEDVLHRIKVINSDPGDGTIIDQLVADGFASEDLADQLDDYLELTTHESLKHGGVICHWEVIDLED